MTGFRAFRIRNDDAGYRAGFEEMATDALTPGEVLVKVAYSSVNYKDALAGTGKGRILRRYPLNGGIDVAGHVVASTDPAFKEGDAVLCTGSGLSETRDGGYAEYARLEARWTIPLPQGLSLRESMVLGTAGFTAALGLLHMQDNGQTPALGPIAVTGASGGVGQLAIDIYSRAGYAVHAISGKTDHFDILKSLGAAECIDRHALAFSGKPMDSVRFGGALDNVGGAMLAGLLPLIAPYGNVAICGNAGGIGFESTVMPFIIRGV
ncbi:MAG TPA: YhdH/YhfP family quinone oxidoreductase, partial [Devosia sp.]|nr:YhdH/YhfP family quinone oxidoreductase [Devosia sp.]